jgi:transcription elongation factor Elf1
VAVVFLKATRPEGVTMTKWRREEISCPECNHVEMVTLHGTINVTLDSGLKEELFEDQINVFNCTNCGEFRLIPLNLLYHDMDKKIQIWEQYSDSNLREETKSCEEKLPPLLLKDRRTRIVYSRSNLIEKILCFDHDLDDRVIEYLKIIVWGKFHREGVDVNPDEIFFDGLHEKYDLVFCGIVEGDEQYIQIPLDVYQAVMDSFKSQPGWEDDIDSDWLTIDRKYVLERFDPSQIEIQ